MSFTVWLKENMPNRPYNPHTVFSISDMEMAWKAGRESLARELEQDNEDDQDWEEEEKDLLELWRKED